MNIGDRIQTLRKLRGISQEELADKIGVSRQSVSKWEMDQSLPEIDKVIQMSRLFSVGTDGILLEPEEAGKLRPQELHLGSVYLIARDFEASVSFYEQLLSMGVSTRNCGNKFAEFFFDNKCLSVMNEENLPGHHYGDGDYKFVLNFWVEDLRREYQRLQGLKIGRMTEIKKVHEGYYYFHIFDPDNNVCEITGGYTANAVSETETQDRRSDMKTICQSCGMEMGANDYGKNADGSRNSDYCKYCFPNGNFGKDETMEEMIESCIPFRIGQDRTPEDARKEMLALLPTLKRWKNQGRPQ